MDAIEELRRETDALLADWGKDKKRPYISEALGRLRERGEELERRTIEARDEADEALKSARAADREKLPNLRRRRDEIQECLEDIWAVLGKMRPELSLRQTSEFHAALQSRTSRHEEEFKALRKDLARYPELARPLVSLLTRCLAFVETGEHLRRDLKEAGLDVELPVLTADLVEGRPETRVRAIWDPDRDGVFLPSLFREHSDAFALWPRDSRVSEVELLAPPSPRYVSTPSEPESEDRAVITQVRPDGKVVKDHGVTYGPPR